MRVYWDCGPSAIQRFLVHHEEMCMQNRFCNLLKLRTLVVEPASDDEGDGEPVRRLRRKNPYNAGMCSISASAIISHCTAGFPSSQ
jgi:hypothetical protein